MVGDDPEAQAVGALEAGLGAVWVGEAQAWPAALPHRPEAIIASAAALPTLAARLSGGPHGVLR